MEGSSGVEDVDESRDRGSVNASSSDEDCLSKTPWLRWARKAFVGGTDLLHAKGEADKEEPLRLGLGGLRDCFEPGTNAGLRPIT